MEVGHVPVAGATSAISTFVWLLALAYLYTEMTTDERAMGVFILPLLVALAAIPAFRPSVEDRAAVLQGPLFGIHVSSLLFAYASFAIACVIGITYVLLFKEIKAKHLGFFYARLPSLQVLDQMNQRAIVIGWIFLTVGIVVGVVWAAQARAYAAGDPRVQAMSLQDPKIFVALVCWGVYSFELFAARRIGWGGRRAAYLSAVGFAIVLLNFVPISYFFTNSHNF
jgi:ABC-type transport system involved in cytochrome c biogenesis permease subunit